MSDKFHYIIEPERGIEYGTLRGWYFYNSVIFIKLPPQSDCYGYRKKYCRLANALNARTGFHVICAENHGDDISEKYDIEVLKQFVTEEKFDSMNYIFIGVGEGATYGLSYLYHQINFKKMLLINMPITHEIGKTIDLLNGVDRNKVKFVYGEEDPSYRYTPLLKRLYADVVTIKGADHNFTGMSNVFVDLQKLL